MSKFKKILLIGGSSYLGQKIIEKLQSRYDITLLNRHQINDFDLLVEKTKGIVFDVLINTIVQYEVKNISTLIESNFYLGFKVYDSIEKSKNFKLIQFGSFYSKFYDEKKIDSYLLSKESLLKYCKLVNSINNTNVFYLQLEHLIGPDESVKKFNGWLKHCLEKDLRITLGPCDHYFDFIHVSDVINLIELLIDTEKFRNEFKLLEVGSGRSTMLKTFVLKLKKKLNSNSEISFSSQESNNDYKYKSSFSDIDELIDLGWNPKNDINEIIDDI